MSESWRQWFTERLVVADGPELTARLSAEERDLLDELEPASAGLLTQRALLKRVDTKFILPRAHLRPLLQAFQGHFALVLSDRARAGRYRTLYFDTPDRRAFHDHRRGVRPRYKVRIRHYLDRDLGFLEIKAKDKHRTTTKSRRPHAFGDMSLDEADERWVLEGTPGFRVEPVVLVDFPRLTLVGLHSHERLTLDLGLSLRWRGLRYDLPEVVVGELKQEAFRPRTPGMLALRSQRMRPQRISKYCVSMALLEPHLPPHRFRLPLCALRREHHA